LFGDLFVTRENSSHDDVHIPSLFYMWFGNAHIRSSFRRLALNCCVGSTPSEEMTYKNIDAAFKYLTNEQGIPPSQIVVYGRSLGSGPSCYLAAKTAREGKSVAGLILHSPFLSIFRIVMDCGFSISGDMFKNIAHAPDIR
jgi:dienelactone hydrolase